MNALIFDLDNCLCPARAVGEHCFAPAFEAIRRAAPGDFGPSQLRRVFRDCWTHDFEAVCVKHGLAPEMRRAGLDAFAAIEVKSAIAGYGDLPLLRELPGQKFLVTSGFRKLQQSKVRALGLSLVFDDVFVDAVDSPLRKGRLGIFADILGAGCWRRSDVWVVGDNADSELAAGNALGCTTIQMLRPGVTPSGLAAHQVRGLRALRQLLAQHGRVAG